MQCPNCKSPIHMSESRCPHCGADRPPRRFFSEEPHPFELTPEDPDFVFEETPEIQPREFDVERRDLLGNRFREKPEEIRNEPMADSRPETRWGGFWRRVIASIVDAVLLAVLLSIMFVLSLIGYKVGLASHNRSVTWETAIPLIS